MKARAYYNEWEPYAAQWLRNLMAAGLIADGVVDDRSIVDVSADDLVGFSQCHFFAGIGGWQHALQLAGWPEEKEVWTASCPCQPFSAIGQGAGIADERHLWPHFFELASKRRPCVVFGEQVASPDGLQWLDVVFSDMEGAGYACAPVDLCAAGIGAPHIRQRIYFAAIALDHACGTGLEGFAWDGNHSGEPRRHHAQQVGSIATPSALGDFWKQCEWVDCADGKRRPIEPGTFPLVDGVSERVGKLRAYGNAIVPQVAAEFIRACYEHLP